MRFAHLLAGGIPAAAVLVLVLRYGVNVPYWDQWELVPNFVALSGGSLGLSDLAAQHNEHRMVFPRLIMLVLGTATQWNTVAEMVFSVGLAVCTLTVLLRLARPLLEEMGPLAGLCVVASVSTMLFSWMQWENWFWGWQIQWFLSVLATVLSIALASWSLHRESPRLHVTGSALAALVVQYSIASGVVVWLLSGFILAFHRRRLTILPLWAAVAGVFTALYFIGYIKPAHHPSLLAGFESPKVFLAYLGNYLSGPIGRSSLHGLAMLGLFLALTSFACIRWRARMDLVLPWLAIGGFAVANALLTGLGRAGFGAAQGLSSRYVTIALLLSIAVVPLGLLAMLAWIASRRWRSVAGAGLAAVTFILTVRGDARSIADIQALHQKMIAGRQCVLLEDLASDECLLRVYVDASATRTRISQLRNLHWGGFADRAALPAVSLMLKDGTGEHGWRVDRSRSPIGWLDGAKFDQDDLLVWGWSRSASGVTRVLVTVSETLVAETGAGLARPDVAAAMGDPGLGKSGWMVRLRRGSLPTEAARLRAYLVIGSDVLAPLDGEIAVPREP